MNKKTERITIHVTPREKEMLKSVSRFYGISLSTFMLFSSFYFADKLSKVFIEVGK